MKKTLQTLRYLVKSFSSMTFIGFLCILATLALTDLIFALTDRYDNVLTIRQDVTLPVPIDIAAGIFALLTGLLFFIVTFKVALANGISRKTFLLANLPSAIIAAAVFSLFNLTLVLINKLFGPIALSFELFYPQIGLVWLLIMQIALYFLLIVVGWFISLAYYRSNILAKWAISLAPFVLFGLLKVVDAYAGGKVFVAINDYLLWSLMFPRVVLSLLTYSAILYGLVYLIIRRAPLKD